MSSSTILTQNVFESIRNTYLLENLLEEIRVMIKSDVKISVNDIKIEAGKSSNG
jgi:DNA replication factor GINS